MTHMAQGEKLLEKDLQDIKDLPLVSVIVPTKDRPRFLSSALESILHQTYKNIEIIVINDGGEDISHIIALYNGSTRIVYLCLEKSRGPSASRNAGLQNASGKYIAYLDDDDIFYPGHIETMVCALEEGGYSVAYADSYQVFQRREGSEYVTIDKRLTYSEDFDRRRLLVMNYIRTENIVHRRDCLEDAGMFDEGLRTHEDWDYWIRLSAKYDFRHIKTTTAEFRTRLNSTGITASNRPDFLRTMKIIHARYAQLSSGPDIIRQQKFVEGELEKEIDFKTKLALEPGSFSVVEARTGRPSLRVKTRDGNVKTLHSIYDPEAEARNAVDAFGLDGRGIIVVLGLGMGYHVSEIAGRYPDTEIIVVEACAEVYELANEHGFEARDKITLLIGLHPDSVLREITAHQMKDGITPLSVFPLSSEVSIFPDYYQPIVSSLKKTISVKLWERLKYSKFREDACKVLLVDSGYFLVREAEKTFRSLGHKVLRVPIDTKGNGETMISRFVEAIMDAKPDFLLTMNHIGFDEDGVLARFFSAIEMPVASWYVDSPRLIVEAFDKNVSPWMSLFLWDKSYIKDMETMGFESINYLPLGTDESLFRPLTAGKHKKKLDKYSCDIGFVGNSMVEPVKEWMEKVGPDFYEIVEKAAEHIARSPNLHGDIMNVIPEKEREKIAGLSKKEKMDLEAAVLWKATLLYRLACVGMLRGFNASIYGDSAWKGLISDRNFRLFPPLNYYKELPYFYNACKINVNATSRQMKEAVNQRVFDVPACGSFVLTDYQESLEGLFEVGKEIVIYKDKDEIPGLVKFYLDNSGEREAVAKRGRERVLKEHTYRHRLEKLIKVMKKRYQ